MKYHLMIGIILAGNLFAYPFSPRDCSLEGKLAAEDIIAALPRASNEEKLQACTTQTEFFESKVHSCLAGSYEKGCSSRIAKTKVTASHNDLALN